MMKTDNIETKQDFMRFLENLIKDYDEVKWENSNLPNFFEAMIRYAEDIDGYYKNMNLEVDPEKASWRLLADIMAGARIYE